MEEKLLEILAYTLPSVITGGVAYYFFAKHIAHEEGNKRFYLHKEHKKMSFPACLQAYERMVLFLERINPNKLLTRVLPTSEDHIDYLNLLINSVQQEFEHNLSQQIYMSNKSWDMIIAAKNATLQLLRNKAATESVNSVKGFQEGILADGISETHPSVVALAYVKKEVRDLF